MSQQVKMNENKPISIQWTNLSLTIKKTSQNLLNNLTGSIKSGQALYVMGQSGAGKSSFLSIMTSRITTEHPHFQLSGQLTYNGKNLNSQQILAISSFVRQDDLLLPTMTVSQTLKFQADLKLYNLAESEKNGVIQKLLYRLNLYECRNTLVGGNFFKSISGGEKKRLAIGVELLSNPRCLILDEPTSGLDSHNAFKIVKLLKELAEEGKVVISAIHQPSSLMFREFDQLLVLHCGETIYLGSASKIVPYMQQLKIDINYKMNPCDFFMLEISDYKKSKGYSTPMNSTNYLKILHKPQTQQFSHDEGQDMLYYRQDKAPFKIQFRALLLRSFRSFYRTPSNIIGKCIGMLLFPLMMGSLYHGLGNKFPGMQDFQALQLFFSELSSFIFILSFFGLTKNLYDTLLSFTNQKQITLKEIASNLYSLFCYFICRCLIQLPVGIILLLWTAPLVYWLAELEPGATYLLRYIGILILMSLVGYMLGFLIGILFSDGAQAAQVVPIFIIPISIFGGLLANLRTLPSYISWLQYLSPLRHCYSFIMSDQLNGDKFDNIGQYEIVRELLGINGAMLTDFCCLLGMFVGLSLLAIFVLYRKKQII